MEDTSYDVPRRSCPRLVGSEQRREETAPGPTRRNANDSARPITRGRCRCSPSQLREVLLRTTVDHFLADPEHVVDQVFDRFVENGLVEQSERNCRTNGDAVTDTTLFKRREEPV